MLSTFKMLSLEIQTNNLADYDKHSVLHIQHIHIVLRFFECALFNLNQNSINCYFYDYLFVLPFRSIDSFKQKTLWSLKFVKELDVVVCILVHINIECCCYLSTSQCCRQRHATKS